MTITYRRFQNSDIPAIIQVANAVAVQQNDPGRVTEEWLEQIAAAPHIHAADDFFVAQRDDQTLVGASLMMMRAEGAFFADAIVHPEYYDTAIAAELIRLSEERAAQRVNDELSPQHAVVMNLGVTQTKMHIRATLERSGYQEARRQYVMRIALTPQMTRLAIPPEYAFRPFEKERDGKRVHAVFQECFAEHWGGVSLIPFEEWSHQFQSADFDPTLWYILYRHEDIAAICLCEPSSREELLGIVEILGVRPAFRSQGLGGLLLRHAFFEFLQRGYQEVALDVDTQNTTNAVALYEQSGMSVYRCNIFYQKVLREN